MNIDTTELIGYSASLVLMLSFTMKEIKKLRMINALSCTLFITYGFMLATAWPIIIANTFVLSVNLWYLFSMKKAGSL